jgi:anthranilate/para-aminobenzoate synthase component I
MTIAERKKKLIAEMQSLTDEQTLQALEDVLYAKVDADEVVAYSVVGEPLTLSDYAKAVKKAEDSIAKGDFLTQEELEEESEKW